METEDIKMPTKEDEHWKMKRVWKVGRWVSTVLFIRELGMSVSSSQPLHESQGSVCLTWLKISRTLSSDTEKRNPPIKLKGAIGYFQRSFHPPGWSEESFSVFCEEALTPVHSPCQGQGFAYEPLAWPDFVAQANRSMVQGKRLCDCYSVSHCLNLRMSTFHNLNNLLRVYYPSSLKASDNEWTLTAKYWTTGKNLSEPSDRWQLKKKKL